MRQPDWLRYSLCYSVIDEWVAKRTVVENSSGKLIKVCSKAIKLFACVLVAERSLELQLLDRLLHSQARVDAQNKNNFSHMKFANFMKSSNGDHSLQCSALIKAMRFGG